MARWLRWLDQDSDGTCIGLLVGVLMLHGLSNLAQGSWLQTLMAMAQILFIVVGYRLLLRWLDRSVILMEAAPPRQIPVLTCRFEQCGAAWVLRALHTNKCLMLEEGDILHVVIGVPRYEGEEDAP
jgi:hypothetical protein